MKVTLGKLVNAQDALKEAGGLRLPAKAAVAVALLIKEVTPLIGAYQEVYNAKLAEHGTPMDGNPGKFSFSSEQAAALTTDINEALAVEHELAVQPMEVEQLKDAEVTPGTLAALDWFFILK